MRNFSPQLLAAIKSKKPLFCHVLKIEFDTPVYFTDWHTNLLFDGDTYLAKIWQGMSDAKMSAKPQVNALDLEFSGADQTMIDIIGSQNWINRKITIKRVYLDSNHQVIGSFILSIGRVEKPTQKHGKSSSVMLKGSTEWANHEQANGTRCTVESQQLIDPTDYCYELTAQVNENVPWGKESSSSSGRYTKVIEDTFHQ